jgi:hypothetical protein
MNEEAKVFLRECIIQSTLDDYENIETLASEIAAWAKKENQPYSFETLTNVIQELTDGGLLKSYSYSKQTGNFIRAQFNRSALNDLWFLAVPQPAYDNGMDT